MAPEAACGGPIAAVANGDTVVIDIEKRRIDMEVPDADIQARMAKWKAPEPRYKRGVFSKYAALVSSASEGAVTFVKS
jgi:dihydroxy-acid dehydratase